MHLVNPWLGQDFSIEVEGAANTQDAIETFKETDFYLDREIQFKDIQEI